MRSTCFAERSTFRSHHDDIHHIRTSQRARFLVLTAIGSTRRCIRSHSGTSLSFHRFSDANAFLSIIQCGGLRFFNLRAGICFCLGPLGDRRCRLGYGFGRWRARFARTAAPKRPILLCSAVTLLRRGCHRFGRWSRTCSLNAQWIRSEIQHQ